MIERKRGFPFPIPFSPPPNPVEALEMFNRIVADIDRTAQKVDRLVSGLSLPEREPIVLPQEVARELSGELDWAVEQASKGMGLVAEGRIGEAAKLLTEASDKMGGRCPVCGELLRKAALEVGLAGVSKSLGEDWRSHANEALSTLSRIREVVPKLKARLR